MKITQRNRPRARVSLPFFIGAALLLIVAAYAVLHFAGIDQRRYEAALQFLEDGEYSQAEAAFAELPGFRDSDSLLVVSERNVAFHNYISIGHHPELEFGLGSMRSEVEQVLGSPVQEFTADGGDHLAYELDDNYVCYGFPHDSISGRGLSCSRLIVGNSYAHVLGSSMKEVSSVFGEPDFIGYSEYFECWVMSYYFEDCDLLLLAEDDSSEITALDMDWPD